jgi:hypothetical protein
MCEHTVLKNDWKDKIPPPRSPDEIFLEKCKNIKKKIDGDLQKEKRIIKSKGSEFIQDHIR